MSTSSRNQSETDPHVDLPVFVNPTELAFTRNRPRSILTVYNPYGIETQFRMMTTNPNRFDVSVTKGIIKPNRRIDISIRLLNQKTEDQTDATLEPHTIDFFRIYIQVGQLKGSRQVKVVWSLTTDLLDTEVEPNLINFGDDKSSKTKIRSTRTSVISTSSGSSNKQALNQRHSQNSRQSNQADGSNVNLASAIPPVCAILATVCLLVIFLPTSPDSEVCKIYKNPQEQATTDQQPGLLSQVSAFFTTSYEVKLVSCFALGLFTYRLISTLPE